MWVSLEIFAMSGYINVVCDFFLFFGLYRVTPVGYGSSQARGQIGASVGLHHQSKAGSEPHLQPTSQLTATQDP